jgi:hypothetical protein
MPFSGQDKFASGSKRNRELSVQRMQQIRSGQWNQIPPDRTPKAREMERSRSKKEAILNPEYFRPSSTRERYKAANQRSIEGFMERIARLNSDG